MGSVLEDLGNETVYSLHKTGTEEVGGTISNIESALVVYNVSLIPSEPDYRIEYVATRNGTYTHRAVVDGSRIWFYTVATNTYSSFTYTALNPADRPATIFRTLRKLITSEDQLLFQTAHEAYEARIAAGSYAARWLPWMPVYNSLVVSGGVVEAVSQVPNYRYIAYETGIVSSINVLNRILGRTERTRGGTLSINTWNINVHKFEMTNASYPIIPAPGSVYRFTPPAGARAVPGSLAQGG